MFKTAIVKAFLKRQSDESLLFEDSERKKNIEFNINEQLFNGHNDTYSVALMTCLKKCVGVNVWACLIESVEM